MNKNNKKKMVDKMKEDNRAKVIIEQYTSELKAIHEYVKEIPAIKKKLDGTFEAVGELSEKMTVVEESISGLSRDVKVLKEDVKELKADMKSVKGRLSKIESRLVSLEFDSRASRDNYKDIKGHLIAVEEELQEIKNIVKSKAERKEIENLENRLLFLENKFESKNI